MTSNQASGKLETSLSPNTVGLENWLLTNRRKAFPQATNLHCSKCEAELRLSHPDPNCEYVECENCEYTIGIEAGLGAGQVITYGQYVDRINERSEISRNTADEKRAKIRERYAKIGAEMLKDQTKKSMVKTFLRLEGCKRATAENITERINTMLSFAGGHMSISVVYVRQVLNKLSETNLVALDFQPHGCYSRNRYTSLVPVNETITIGEGHA